MLRLYRATPPDWLANERDVLRELEVPVLVAWGSSDRYLPTVQAHRQLMTFPAARVELFDGLGHWAFLEDPDRVARVVVPFLAAQLA